MLASFCLLFTCPPVVWLLFKTQPAHILHSFFPSVLTSYALVSLIHDSSPNFLAKIVRFFSNPFAQIVRFFSELSLSVSHSFRLHSKPALLSFSNFFFPRFPHETDSPHSFFTNATPEKHDYFRLISLSSQIRSLALVFVLFPVFLHRRNW